MPWGFCNEGECILCVCVCVCIHVCTAVSLPNDVYEHVQQVT